MTKNLEEIIELSDKMLSFRTQRLYIKEKFEAAVIFGNSGGIFRIDQSLISYVKTLIDFGKKDNVVILDMNQNPIMISDLSEFLKDIIDRYMSALGRYYSEYQELQSTRPGSWRITRKA
jgi:hypothetical protein